MQQTLLLVLVSLLSISSYAERGRLREAFRRHLDQNAQRQQQGQRPVTPQQQSPYAQFEAAADAITAAVKKKFYELYDRYDDGLRCLRRLRRGKARFAKAEG